MALASGLLLLLSAVASNGFHTCYEDKFYYHKLGSGFFRRLGDEECNVCFDNECVVMGQARCEFYQATSELLQQPTFRSSPVEMTPSLNLIRSQVDNLMGHLVVQATRPDVFKDCIPYISEYTNCYKENACLDCKTCSCSEEGTWDCNTISRCQLDLPSSNIDHRALLLTMESLRRDEKSLYRIRRSATNEPATKPHTLSFEEIAEWMYGIGAFRHDNPFESSATEIGNTAVDIVKDDLETKTDSDIPSVILKTTTADYVAFDDVLNNIEVQDKENKRRKMLHVDNDNTEEYEFINYDNNNETFNAYTNNKEPVQFVNMLNEFVYQADNIDTTTKMIVDLLEGAERKPDSDILTADLNKTDYKENVITTNSFIYSTLENTNDAYDFDAVNIMKRDVSKIKDYNSTSPSNTTGHTNQTIIDITTENDNILQTPDLNVKAEVLTGLNRLICAKENELKDLKFIKDKLTQLIKLSNDSECALKVNHSLALQNATNLHFTFYNLDLLSELSQEIKKSNSNRLSDHLDKLRRDILVVIKDIVLIQKLVGKGNFPQDLKTLIHAMKHYVHKSEKLSSKSKNKEEMDNILTNTRRYWTYSYKDKKYLVHNYLLGILQVIDSNMPESNALDPLSTKSRSIIQRVIKINNGLDKSLNNLRINDPQYNISNDLKNIGASWPALSLNVLEGETVNILYDLKLLHFALVSDITKMVDALDVIDYVTTRRLMTVGDDLSDRELRRINDDLKNIYSKITRILEFKPLKPIQRKKVNIISNKKPAIKENLLRHIKSLLKNSKRDIMKLLRKKVPKSEIVKELARKKLDELTKSKLIEYKTVMQKWQKNLNVNSRSKRSIFNFDNVKDKIKNILPKYLRGKVHSGLHNNTKNKKGHNFRQSKKSPHRKNRNHKNTDAPSTATTKISTLQISTTTAHTKGSLSR